MSNLRKRGRRTKVWSEMGNVSDLKAAAHMILEEENDHAGAIFFRLYVDPVSDITGKDDGELLSRLEYNGANSFYLLTRKLH